MSVVTINFDREKDKITVSGKCLSAAHARAHMNYNVPMTWGDKSDGTKQTAVVLALHLQDPISKWKQIFNSLASISPESGDYTMDLETFGFSELKKKSKGKSE